MIQTFLKWLFNLKEGDDNEKATKAFILEILFSPFVASMFELNNYYTGFVPAVCRDLSIIFIIILAIACYFTLMVWFFSHN